MEPIEETEHIERALRLGLEAAERLAADPLRAAEVAKVDVALAHIRRSMARRGLGRRVLAELGLNIDASVAEVLEAVDAEDDRDAGDIAVGTVAARLLVDASQASRLVAEAVRLGLVRRVPSQADGRRSALALSDTGKALLASTRNYKRSLLRDHFAGWSDSDLSDFARLLTRFSSIARPGDGP